MRAVSAAFRTWSRSLHERSHAVPVFLRRRMTWFAAGWIGCAGLASFWKISTLVAGSHSLPALWPALLTYAAIIAAPMAGYGLAASAYSEGRGCERTAFRFAVVGTWERLSRDAARAHPLFGPAGFVASLVIGLMLNVVIRSGEFFLALPAVPAGAPEWALAMFVLMAADLVVMNFFYMVALVMALRNVPLFPRMLLFVWLTDVMMQVTIANQVGQVGSLPGAVAEPLSTLLEGNLQKVAISMAIWTPYLLLSERVNVTYRLRRRV